MLWSLCIYGQLNNDECFTATNIEDLTDFCSMGSTTVTSTESAEDSPTCWLNSEKGNDVWYLFTPREEGLLLRFFGDEQNNDFTLSNFAVTVYEGRCNQLSELMCRVSNAEQSFERLFNNLIIGRPHYIRVSNVRDSEGTFQICLRQFIPVPEPEQDCGTGVVLCDKSTFVVEKLDGVGVLRDEAAGSCLDGLGPNSPPTQSADQTETSSVWYRWTAATTGSLTFTLFPNNDDSEEDLDFAIYRLPQDINDCAGKELLRCMASGAPDPNRDRICLGPTGLREGETDVTEFTNCEDGSNNFLAPLDMIAGESYVLVVNNFSNSGFGFTIEFGGTGEFLGPIPDFAFTTVDDFECDKTITFENLSNSMTDLIVDYNWRFGEGAMPQSATGEGPHDVIYETFGPKVAVLTVETARGCRVTKVLDLEVASCCDDMVQLTLDPTLDDLSCFESGDGVIQAIAQNGSPDYLYSLDNGPLLPTDIFNGLAAGDYTLSARDIKGCEVTQVFTLTQPEEIVLTLTGPADTIELGRGGQLLSSFTPLDRILTYMWSPPDGLSCADCPNPDVIPPGTTQYTLEVTDQDGCMQTSDIVVFTTVDRPFYAPNIISLNPADPENGTFRVISGVAADALEEFIIYDRWGSELHREDNSRFDDGSHIGWSGLTGRTGQKVNPGVYIWIAKVRFVDRVVLTFTGDVTVVD